MQWNHKIFSTGKAGFEGLALEIFRLQAAENPLYKSYISTLGTNPGEISLIEQVPFLPIQFFKTHSVQTGEFEPVLVFESSGTTGMVNSRHLVKNPLIYEESFIRNFENRYGPLNHWCILGLLPSYLERQHSSLVYMVNRMIHMSGHGSSGFYLDNYTELAGILEKQERNNQKTLLIGVSFALLDFAEKFPLPLKHTVIMETGGMKGRRKEMIREELHHKLKKAFDIPQIHSEYGMAELLSQAYSPGEGIFHCPPWMQIRIRDEEDPFHVKKEGSGIINVIDLANVHSCAFIATEDAGKLYADGSFEVLGRVDGSDMRGCSLLVVG